MGAFSEGRMFRHPVGQEHVPRIMSLADKKEELCDSFENVIPGQPWKYQPVQTSNLHHFLCAPQSAKCKLDLCD